MALIQSLSDEQPRVKRWSFDEYMRLAEIFAEPSPRLELIDGEIFEKLSQNPPHILSCRLVVNALRAAFGPEFDVNSSFPTRMGDHSAPEPDIMVLRGMPRDFEGRWPEAHEIPLVVEVADSRPDTARGAKVRLYARFGIAEYWILDVRKRVLEVRRGPLPEAEQWTETRIYQASESIAPLGATGSAISIADLLPRPDSSLVDSDS